MVRALIALGSNQGDREALLREAVARLKRPQLDIRAVSPWLETQPAGGPTGQGLFLNGAVLVETSLKPAALLAVLKEIEQQLGRTGGERWAARPIDLDLLLYGEEKIACPTLTVPHPRMAWRRFVLEPAAAIAGDMLHPTTRWTISRLATHLRETRPYVAITGLSQTARREVAWHVASLCGGTLISAGDDEADASLEAGFEQAISRVRAAVAEQPADRLLVSDFWYGDWLGLARVCTPAGAFSQFEKRWRSRRGDVPTPRLVVLLDKTSDDEDDGLVTMLRQSLTAELARPDVGPVMRLTNLSIEAAVAEVAAAVESM